MLCLLGSNTTWGDFSNNIRDPNQTEHRLDLVECKHRTTNCCFDGSWASLQFRTAKSMQKRCLVDDFNQFLSKHVCYKPMFFLPVIIRFRARPELVGQPALATASSSTARHILLWSIGRRWTLSEECCRSIVWGPAFPSETKEHCGWRNIWNTPVI